MKILKYLHEDENGNSFLSLYPELKRELKQSFMLWSENKEDNPLMIFLDFIQPSDIANDKNGIYTHIVNTIYPAMKTGPISKGIISGEEDYGWLNSEEGVNALLNVPDSDFSYVFNVCKYVSNPSDRKRFFSDDKFNGDPITWKTFTVNDNGSEFLPAGQGGNPDGNPYDTIWDKIELMQTKMSIDSGNEISSDKDIVQHQLSMLKRSNDINAQKQMMKKIMTSISGSNQFDDFIDTHWT